MKKKLIEKVTVKPKEIQKLEIKENHEITENQGNKVKCVAAYTFPISRPGKENLNERIYPIDLWEKVIKEKMAENSFGLLDHPEDEGSIKDAACVWKEARFNKDRSLLMADCYLFGNNGRHIKEAIDAGAEIGLSTVGYGDFEDDGKTVQAESYELARMADFVLDPSYQVYGKKEDEINNENIQKSSTIKEDDINKKDEVEYTMSDKLKKLEVRNFKHKINNAIEDIEKIKDVDQKLREYKDLYVVWEEVDYCPDLKESVEKSIDELSKQYEKIVKKGKRHTTIVEKAINKKLDLEEENAKIAKNLKEKQNHYDKLEKKYQIALKLLKGLKDHNLKIKNLYKKIKEAAKEKVDKDIYQENVVYCKVLENEIVTLKEKVKKISSANQKYKKKFEDMIKKQKSLLSKKEAEKAAKIKAEKEVAKLEKIKKMKQEKINKIRNIDFRNNEEIKEWFQDIVESDPKAIDLEDDINTCKTLIEAQKMYLNYREILDTEPEIQAARSRFDRKFKENLETELNQLEFQEDYDDYHLKRNSWV